MTQPRHPATETDPAALLALIEGCANPGVVRAGLLLRLSGLPAELRRPRHLRLIDAALDPLRSLDRAACHRLADGTIVAAWRGSGGAELRETLAVLDEMFADLPEIPHLTFQLPRDGPMLARVVAASLPTAVPPAREGGRPLDPALLSALEFSLAQADVSNHVRRRPICAWPADAPPARRWDMRVLAADSLAAALCPGTDLAADPWLFRRLTRSFDTRLLSLLSNPAELRNASAFALDLNLASLLGPAFLRFDAALPRHLRGHAVLAVPPDDLLADPATFAFARDYVRARGYRIALRDLPPAWLGVFPPDRTGVDLVWLRATANDRTPVPPGLAARIVLCNVADAATLLWGRSQGITLFEGSLVTAAAPPPSRAEHGAVDHRLHAGRARPASARGRRQA